ncbi:A-agglutinin anchorage subunit-like isoform X2 [Haliotis rufescens]|uniref:A-agglutinin anchorage subunit-like isoform X2 n=1 Tax=Haliotis rufescens TaxID=6454 RepID=UPI00201F4B69|nr:A-agglutinin anchorage subunit-like isoform X2 [Haliotis rufescens]
MGLAHLGHVGHYNRTETSIQLILNKNMTTFGIVLIGSIALWSAEFLPVSTDRPCQGNAHLGGEYNISAEIPYAKYVWRRPDGQFVITCSPNCSPTAGYNATLTNGGNTTKLMIQSVAPKDVGTWRITNTSEFATTSACNLDVAGLPSCNINSSQAPHSLEPNSMLTLDVDIRGYFCSKQAQFDLTSGREVPDVWLRNKTVTDATNTVLDTTFNVTLKRLGNIKLDFTCANTTYNLACGGVNTLLKSPPQCEISSSRNGSLMPGTSLTLTVNITNYYCTEEAAFNLTTGSVEEELVGSHHVVDINSTVVMKTFNVTPAHNGNIKVSFSCDDINRELSCTGDDTITIVGVTSTAKPPTSTPTSTTSTSTMKASTTSTTSTNSIPTSTTTSPTPASVSVYLIIGIVAALLVVLIIIFVLVVCRNRISRVAKRYIVTRKRPQIQNLRENEKPNKGKRMSQINPDKKTDFVKSVLGSTPGPDSRDKRASVTEMQI